jgi:hypothetical protein
MGFIRKIKQRGKTYYAEVENQWINGKCVQKHIRSLGSDPEHPNNIPRASSFLISGTQVNAVMH